MEIGFALRAISSVLLVASEQKFYLNDRKPITMLIAILVAQFRLSRRKSLLISVRSLFGRKIVTMEIGFALRAISSVLLVASEQKFYLNDRKPIAMLIAILVAQFRLSRRKSVLISVRSLFGREKSLRWR
jgi:uncharacterized membrane protein (UPF0136 family)